MLPRQNSSRPYTSGSFKTKLELFEKFIAEFTYVDDELNPEERRQILQTRLTNGYEPFCEAIRDLFGNDVSTQDLKALFRKIALNPDAEVDWSELFGIGSSTDEVSDLLLNEDTSSVFTTNKRRTVADAGGDKKRRDVVQSIVYVPKYDFYITASQKGIICHFSSKFRIKACTDIHESAWVTGCGFLPSLRRIVVTSERALTLWDYRAKQKQSTIYRIKPLENSPQCMTYIPWKTNSLNEDTIIFGDDQGYVNMLTISSKDLHMKNSTSKNDGQVVNIEPAKLSNEIRRRKFHDDWVLKLRYFPQLEMFGSCSPSSTCSFVLGTLERILDNSPARELAVPKGVNCFDYCSRANVIITAGADKVIRIWHPLIFTRPTGKLLGHLFTLVELAVNEKDQQLVSLSTARVFRVWDIQTLTCLQVFTDNEVRPGEKRISSMLFDAKHDRLITGCSVIDTWPLTRAIQDSLQVPHSHDRPICQLFYNPQMNQVITGCTEGSMKVWEMETGQLVYQVPEAHGPSNEITAITTDSMGYRLVTGAYDGSIKVWDFGSGQLYKSFPDEPKKTKHDDTITGLVYHLANNTRYIFVSAWGRKIRILEDSYDEPVLLEIRTLNDLFMPTTPRRTANQDFSTFVSRAPLPSIGETEECARAGEVHALSTCEVTCLDYHDSTLLIAGTTDGTVLVWNVETGKIVMRCDVPQGTSARSASRRRRSHQDQKLVHACKLVIHRLRRPIIYGKSGNVSFRVPSEQSEVKSASETELAEQKGSVTEKAEEEGSKSELEPLGEEPAMTEEEESDEEKPHGSPKEGEEQTAIESVENQESPAQAVMEQNGFDRDFLRISEPVLAACYHDGYLRFWSMSGKLLTEIRALTRRHASAVTAMCTDADCKYLVSGDAKGYITVWDVGNFLLDPPAKNAEAREANGEEGTKHTKNGIKQVIAWRGHLSRVVGVEHVTSADIIVSASTDCSARVWYRDTGHFIGYFGQPRLWHLPSAKSVPSTPIRPYDISEVPLKTLRHLTTKTHKAENSVDCPLMFDDERWSPFRHSAKRDFRTAGTGNKKFFDSLSKPKHYNTHLESSRTGFSDTGAVFRALPVYRVETPERLKTPACHPTHQLPKGFSNKANMSYRPSSPTREPVVSRFPHLVVGRKR